MEEWIFQGFQVVPNFVVALLRLGEAPILWGPTTDPANFLQVTASVLTPETSTEVPLYQMIQLLQLRSEIRQFQVSVSFNYQNSATFLLLRQSFPTSPTTWETC